jgi:DNA-directed RNA polymerase specialized sigma24 family protein
MKVGGSERSRHAIWSSSLMIRPFLPLYTVQDATVSARGSFEDVYRAEGARLWRSMLLFTGDAEAAADVVAEAFTQALSGWERIRDPRAWVWKAAFRIASGEMARRRTLVELPRGLAAETPESLVDLIRALAVLAPRQREAVVLHLYAGYRLMEIAGMTGTTPAAAAVHLYRARRRLRSLLEVRDA